MVHCINARADGPFFVDVETNHSNWLKSKLKVGSVFLDVGAATGAMTLPISISRSDVKGIAIEPSRTANLLLRETLRRNAVGNVEVHGFAASDFLGNTVFVEYKTDPAGELPFLPEASTLAPLKELQHYPLEKYDVPLIRLIQRMKNPDVVVAETAVQTTERVNRAA